MDTASILLAFRDAAKAQWQGGEYLTSLKTLYKMLDTLDERFGKSSEEAMSMREQLLEKSCSAAEILRRSNALDDMYASLQDCVEYAEDSKSLSARKRFYSLCFLCCRDLGNYGEAIEFLQKQLKVEEGTMDMLEMGKTHLNVSSCYNMLGMLQESLVHAQEAQSLFIKTGGGLQPLSKFTQARVHAYHNEGMAMKGLGDVEGAIDTFVKGIQIAHAANIGGLESVVESLQSNLNDCYNEVEMANSDSSFSEEQVADEKKDIDSFIFHDNSYTSLPVAEEGKESTSGYRRPSHDVPKRAALLDETKTAGIKLDDMLRDARETAEERRNRLKAKVLSAGRKVKMVNRFSMSRFLKAGMAGVDGGVSTEAVSKDDTRPRKQKLAHRLEELSGLIHAHESIDCPEKENRLVFSVCVIEGRSLQLMKDDNYAPYVILTLDGERKVCKPAYLDQNPKWNTQFSFDVQDSRSVLSIDVFNQSSAGEPMLIGSATLDLLSLSDHAEHTEWLNLTKMLSTMAGGYLRKKTGQVRVRVHLFEVSDYQL